MTTHSSIPAWKIPWTVEPGRLPSMGSQRVGQTEQNMTNTFTFNPSLTNPKSKNSKEFKHVQVTPVLKNKTQEYFQKYKNIWHQTSVPSCATETGNLQTAFLRFPNSQGPENKFLFGSCLGLYFCQLDVSSCDMEGKSKVENFFWILWLTLQIHIWGFFYLFFLQLHSPIQQGLCGYSSNGDSGRGFLIH